MNTFRRPGRTMAAALVAAAAILVSSLPASAAGRWIPGGTYDIERASRISFLRFLAEDGEGQMNIRCDQLDGLTIDVGVAGNAALPPGVAVGDRVEAVLAFAGSQNGSVTVAGPVLVRQDGAVIVTLSGTEAALIAPFLLQQPEHLDITIEGTTRPVPMADLSTRIVSFADHCAGWPR